MSLKQLEKIRSQRLESSSIAVQMCRKAWDQSIADKLALDKQLEEFAVWKDEQRDVLFNSLNKGEFSVDKLDGYNADLNRLDQHEKELMDQAPQKEEAVKKAQKNFEKAQEKLQSVTKDLEKVKEFISVDAKKGLKLEESNEELQIDDLNNARVSR